MRTTPVSFHQRFSPWLLLFSLVLPTTVWAQQQAPSETTEVTLPQESWAGQLEILSGWLEQRNHEARCESRCYVLDRLRIVGDVEQGEFEFVLNGSVLADGPVAVPLFGSPNQVRIEGAVESVVTSQPARPPKPARIGFEGEHYFLFTEARNFTLRGRLILQDDRALNIAGPLNTLETELTNGRVVEGDRISGLSGTTIHFERGQSQDTPDEPTVFQLSRAIRVGREINFEYRLVMRSGSDLGVVRFPLRFGEEVLEVTGSTGWRVDEQELSLPTAGRNAEITVTGTLSQVSNFSPDQRSSYEWWLFESDPEHRLTVEGDGRQFDSSESPIERIQSNSRLFMVHRGQELQVSVNRLPSAEVLGAVVRRHNRTVVLTKAGHLIAQDELDYENNGIDYLLFSPRGRAIYLATDGQSERILNKQSGSTDVMIPLRMGTHNVKVQVLSEQGIELLGGRLEVPLPTYPLTASRAALTLGLPRTVHPIVFFGGDEIRWFVGVREGAAIILAFLVAFIALRRRSRRLLGGVTLAGLWFISPVLYVLALIALTSGGMVWLITRLLDGPKRIVALTIMGGAIALVGLISLALVSISGGSEYSPSSSWANQPSYDILTERSAIEDGSSNTRSGNWMAQVAQGGVLEGVTPVALPLPGYHRAIHSSRELVTEESSFQPVLYYVTDWALLPLVLIWLICLGALGFVYRRDAAHLYQRFLERLKAQSSHVSKQNAMVTKTNVNTKVEPLEDDTAHASPASSAHAQPDDEPAV